MSHITVTQPDSKDVRAARLAAADTQAAAAERLFITTRMWQHYEGGKYLMPPAFWELYLLKTKQIKGV